MEFSFTVLGSSAAIPALGRNLSAHIVQHDSNVFLIDCGDGTQLQLDKHKIKKQKINQIFISHLHGDHVYGLFGLLTSYSLFGRVNELEIFAPAGLKEMIDIVFEKSFAFLTYPIKVHLLPTEGFNLIFENNKLSVFSFPLKHRVACNGFLFREKEKPANINPDKIKKYNLDYESIKAIKIGSDYITADGTCIPNSEMVFPKQPLRSFAYCCDTAYNLEMVPYLENCDLIFHDATFDKSNQENATLTLHSTSEEAAQIALSANAKKLLLGHFSSRNKSLEVLLQEAKSIFDASFLAEEGKKVAL